MPRISARWPEAESSIAQSAAWARAAAEFIEAEADRALARIQGLDPSTLHFREWLSLPTALRDPVLRRWLRALELPEPTHYQAAELVRQLGEAGEDRQPCVRWPGTEVRRYRDLLHAVVVFGDQRDGKRMVRAALGTDEAERVRVRGQRCADLHRGAVGIVDARIEGTTGVLDFDAERDRLLGRDVPRVPQVEVRDRLREQGRIGEPVRRVLLGVARDGAGVFDGLLDRLRVEVGGVRRALAAAEVHGYGDAAVARTLDRLDLAEANPDAEAEVDAGGDVGLAGAPGAGKTDDVLGDRGKAVEVGGAGIFVSHDGIHCCISRKYR